MNFSNFLWFSFPNVPLVAPKLFAFPNAHSEKKMEHSLASCRKIDFLRFLRFSGMFFNLLWFSSIFNAVLRFSSKFLRFYLNFLEFHKISTIFFPRGPTGRSEAFCAFLRFSMIFYDFLLQRTHWSLRGLLGSQMLILTRKWNTLCHPAETLIFLDFLDFL